VIRIGDVSRELGLTVVTVRLWSDMFGIPVRRVNNQRLYHRGAVSRLRLVKQLVRREGYSLDGAKRQYSKLLSFNW
jgi:DNA-binding transcriptional MerR regulator